MNQTEILGLNNTMTELKNSLESFKTKLNKAEESVNWKTGHLTVYRKKKRKRKRLKKVKKTIGFMGHCALWESQKEKRKRKG